MSLEQRTTTFRGNKYNRLFGQRVETKEEVSMLADKRLGGTYFLGGGIRC